MAQADGDDPWTSIPARRSLKERLREAKPYESMSWQEFLVDLADQHEREK